MSLPSPTPPPQPVLTGKPASPEQEFYYQQGLEAIKNNSTVLNDTLRQMVTLSASLLGGSIAFLQPTMVGPEYKNWVVLFFFLALFVAFLGMMPFEGKLDPYRPESVKQYMSRSVRWKRLWVWTTAVLLEAGFFMAVIGMWRHS